MIRIYVEGGGKHNDKYASGQIRAGFSGFIKNYFGDGGRQIRIIACGSRESTIDDFRRALESHPDDFNIVLVDSDGPVEIEPCKYLNIQGGQGLEAINDQQCHLMVQVMESWLVADVATLKEFYGQGFNSNQIPRDPKVEQVDKKRILSGLKEAARQTIKGEYHKIHHGPKILALLDVMKVRQAARHCDRLFTILEDELRRQI
jgi:hypothetical protein